MASLRVCLHSSQSLPVLLRLQYTGTATSSCEIPSGDSGTRRIELGQTLPGSNSGCSGSPGAAKSLIPELARIKLAWDCLWLQCSLGIQLTLIFHHSKCRDVSSDTQHGQKDHTGFMDAFREPQLPNTRQDLHPKCQQCHWRGLSSH